VQGSVEVLLCAARLTLGVAEAIAAAVLPIAARWLRRVDAVWGLAAAAAMSLSNALLLAASCCAAASPSCAASPWAAVVELAAAGVGGGLAGDAESAAASAGELFAPAGIEEGKGSEKQVGEVDVAAFGAGAGALWKKLVMGVGLFAAACNLERRTHVGDRTKCTVDMMQPC
jgi:hypothetical protein